MACREDRVQAHRPRSRWDRDVRLWSATSVAILPLILGEMATEAQAQPTPLYWDGNGSVAGAGSNPNGTWGAGNFWNQSTGVLTPGPWVAGNTAVFCAGTDATSYIVGVAGTQSVAGIRFEEGNGSSLTGGTLSMTSAGIDVASGL